MVDFDLRALAAPLEALKSEVDAAYKRLDERWGVVAAQLRKLPIPCDVGYSYYSSFDGNSGSRLEWRKWNGKRRICIVHFGYYPTPDGDVEESEDVIPYDEWSGEQRIQMLAHVPDLFKSAVEQTKRFIARTKAKE